MLGQSKVRETLGALVATDTLPQTLFFEADRGMGKTELSRWLADEMGAMFYHVEEMKIGRVREVINHALKVYDTTVYHFEDTDTMTRQAQNAILKLAEEPPSKAYVVLGVRNVENMLPTLRSRALGITLERYGSDELSTFLPEDAPEWIMQVAYSPGRVKTLAEDPLLPNLYAMAQTAAKRIGEASLQNVMTISNKVEKDYEFEFAGLVLVHLNKMLKEVSGLHELQYVTRASEGVIGIRWTMQKSYANKKNLLDMMLEKMWRLHRQWISSN